MFHMICFLCTVLYAFSVVVTGIDKSRTNEGTVHKMNLQKWQSRDDGGAIDYSDVRSGWILTAACNGLNGCQTANQANDFFNKSPIENGGTIPKTSDGLYMFLS